MAYFLRVELVIDGDRMPAPSVVRSVPASGPLPVSSPEGPGSVGSKLTGDAYPMLGHSVGWPSRSLKPDPHPCRTPESHRAATDCPTTPPEFIMESPLPPNGRSQSCKVLSRGWAAACRNAYTGNRREGRMGIWTVYICMHMPTICLSRSPHTTLLVGSRSPQVREPVSIEGADPLWPGR